MKICRDPTNQLFLLVEGTSDEYDKAIEALTFIDKKEQKEYEKALQDGYLVNPPVPTCFFDLENNRIFAGHLPYLQTYLRPLGIPFEVENLTPPPWEGEIQELEDNTYRDFQRDAIRTCLEKRVGIVQAATGAGKTVIAGGIALNLGLPSLFLLPQVPLFHQTIGEYNRWGIPKIGIVGDKKTSPKYHTVADARWVGRLLKRGDRKILQWLRTIKVLLVDEGQQVPAATWSSIILACPNAEYRIALSGTPYTSSTGMESLRDFQLQGMFNGIIYTVANDYLKEKGYIAIPEIYMLHVREGLVPTRSVIRPWERGREYLRVYKAGVVHHDPRNTLATQTIFVLAKVHQMGVLVLVQQIEHGIEILSRLQGMGVSAVFVAGDKKVYRQGRGTNFETDTINNFRSETVSKFIAKEFEVLVASPVFGVGYNIPGDAVDATVLLTGGRGHQATLQRLGRALRPRGGDNKVIIIDFYDHQHYYLTAQSKKRLLEYKTEGHEVLDVSAFERKFLTK